MIQELKNIKELVREMLIKYPETRDDDMYLHAKVMYIQNPQLKNMMWIEWAKQIRDKKYIKPETVRRVRQKLQEECSSLRGKEYYRRHKYEQEVRQYMRS